MAEKKKAEKADRGTKPKGGSRHEKRDLAKILFVTTDMNILDIENRLGVTRKTLASWRDADNWEDERTTRNVSPMQIVKRLNAQLEKLLDEMDEKGAAKMTSGTIDMISKLTKSIKDTRNGITPQTTMEVLNGFMAYMADVNLELAQALADPSMSYVLSKMKEAKDK